MSGEMILYNTEDDTTVVQLKARDGSVWLSQAQIAELFEVTPQAVTQHVKAIYEDGELIETATCKEFLQVRTEGNREVSRQIAHYSLPMILAIGFRVRSVRGMQFRRWAATSLSEYLVKGFVMDDARLKEPGTDYFEELLARIRDIRSSERMFYQKVLDIYGTSVDYDRNAETTQLFLQTVQNKMHWAAHGHTAAEVISARVSASKDHVGLTSWANQSKGGPPRKTDVTIAKNYLERTYSFSLVRCIYGFALGVLAFSVHRGFSGRLAVGGGTATVIEILAVAGCLGVILMATGIGRCWIRRYSYARSSCSHGSRGG